MTKRNWLLFALCVLLIATCALLASCNIDFGNIGGEGGGTTGGEGGGTTPPAEEHKHVMVKTEKVEPDCENTGTDAYFSCSECKKLFADAEGKNEISAPKTLEKLPHSWSDVQENENGFFVECTSCGAKESASAPEADKYTAVKNNDFTSDKSYQLEMHYGSSGVTHSGGDDKGSVGEGYMGGIDNKGEYVSYKFTLESAGRVDLVWTVAGNYYSGGSNLGIADMAASMSITIDGKPVNVSGIELPAVNDTTYEDKWWMLQKIVIADVVLDKGVHTFRCDVTAKGGVNIDDLTIYSTKPVANDVRADVVNADIALEDGRIYYYLTYDVAGYAVSDFEFFYGERIYNYTAEREGNIVTFKFDFTDEVSTFLPHLRLNGQNWGHEKGDVLLPKCENHNKGIELNCRIYKLMLNYDMPGVTIKVSHDYASSVAVAPTTASAGKGEVRCSRCNILHDTVGEIELPELSAENGYKVTDGVITRYTYVYQTFTNVYTSFEFNFDVAEEKATDNYTFTASQLFGEIGSTDAEYNEGGYYAGEKDDKFVLVLYAEDSAAVKFSLAGNDSASYGASVISSMTVNGRESNVITVDDTIILVLEKGTNTICFTLSTDVNIAKVSVDSSVEISSIKAEDTCEIMFMSFNIRIDANEGYQDWNARKEAVAAHMLSYSPDVICLQEVQKTQYNDLVSLMSEVYEIVWYGRQTGSNPEGLAVAYKKSEFTEQSRGMFWLSETPDVQSYGWDATSYYRIAVNVILKHNESGQMLNVYSAHLNGHASLACHKSMELIMQKASEYDYPVYIGGDFNAYDYGYGYQVTDANYHDPRVVAPITENANTGDQGGYWLGVLDRTGKPKDHIFVSPEHFIPMEYKICNDKWGEGYHHSDHFAIVSKLLFVKQMME